MIYAYSGRRSHSLPARAQEVLRDRVRRLLIQAKPSAIVGAAACGADLIVLEEALRQHAVKGSPDICVVLPTPAAQFRADSVEPAWRARYDDALGQARARGEVIEADGTAEDVYETGNRRILDQSLQLAGRRGERAVALVIASPGDGEYIVRFVEQAEIRAIRSLRLDPASDPATQRRCFVVMPYGRKWDVQRSFWMDCELTYGQLLVPALEHAQLNYRRADETVDPGVVLRPMISDIAHADLVIADLATGNFNVGWELGLRHLLKDRSTVLIKPAGNLPAPFDVQALRTVPYAHDQRGFSDNAVLEAWESLEAFLEPEAGEGEGETDSPVGALMTLQLAQVEAIGPRDRRVETLRDALADARDLADEARIEAVVAGVGGLPRLDADLVLAEAGTILRRLGRHERAGELLRPIVEADVAVTRPAAHQELAMAIYRQPGAGTEDYAAAERILKNILANGGYPETEALLGAVAKRQARELDGNPRVAELQLSRRSYLAEYERDLNDHYSGVNVLAVDAVLAHVHGDGSSGNELDRLLPAVRVAAELRLASTPDDYWARVTIGEIDLLTVFHEGAPDAADPVGAYRHAREASALPDELQSSLDQLAWYDAMGLDPEPIRQAAEALSMG